MVATQAKELELGEGREAQGRELCDEVVVEVE